LEKVLEVLAGVRGRNLRNRLGRPLGHELAASGAALGPEVEDPVGALDHVEMVLYDEHRVAGVDETLQNTEKPPDIVEMEPGGGLVEDVEEVPTQPGAELSGDLEALRLAARQGRGGLAQAEIAEPDVLEDPESPRQAGCGRKETDSLVHRHLKHLADVAPLVRDLPDVRTVASPLALTTRDVDVLE